MAEHLRNALRDFALQKMRDLEVGREKKSAKDDGSAGKSLKPMKIKINRDSSKSISGSGPSKKPDESQLVASDSKKSMKRQHDESNTGDKITKLVKLYQEGASSEVKNAARKKGSVSAKSHFEQLEHKKPTDDPAMDGASMQEQDGTKTMKRSGWTKVVTEESSKVEPQFKSLPSATKEESDVAVGAEKKSVPMLGDKKTIQIKIQTKLLALPQELGKVATKGSDSESNSSNDDDSDDSDDEIMVVDGLPWRTILEDGELTPTSGEEEEKVEEDDVAVKGEDVEKSEKEKEEEVLDNKGEEKKKSSKHKHKSKHKKHKHKKSKKKSKHKHKDKKEKESTSVSKNDGSTTSEKKTSEGKDARVSGNETSDITHKGDKISLSKDEKQKELQQKDEVKEERKGQRSSSSSRKTSEEREARGSMAETILKEDAKKDKKTEERKEKPRRSHSKSRSSSKEKSHTKDVKEYKLERKENIGENLTKGKDPGREEEEENKRDDEKTSEKHERRRRSSEKVSHSESSKEPKKSEEDDKCVPSSDKLEGRKSGSKEKHTVLYEEERKNMECDDESKSTKMLLEKPKTVTTDSKDKSRTVKESVKSTGTGGNVTVSHDSTSETPMDSKLDESHKNEKQHHDERTMKEEKIQKEGNRKGSRREEERKDGTKEKSQREESSQQHKRHREKGKDKEDKKRHRSKKQQVTTQVKIDHLEHDFPSAEEYAEDSGDKVQSGKKDDVKSKITVSEQDNTSRIQATPSDPTQGVVSPLDDAPAECAVKGKEQPKEESRSVEIKKTLTEATSATNVSDSSTNLSHSDKSKVTLEERACRSDTNITDGVTTASAKQKGHIGDVQDSTTPAKKLEGSSSKSEDASKQGRETKGDVENLKTNANKEATLFVNSESAGGKKDSEDKQEDSSSSDQKEKGAVSTTSATEKPVKSVESGEKKVESKVAEKTTDKESKKKKKDRLNAKEEGAVDSEIEEGEITKKHKKSKKKDKKKDRSEKDRKYRTERDKSEHKDRDKKHKRRRSESRSESHSHSRSSQKKNKGSRSKSGSDNDGDSDISIGKTKMVEKSFFSESKGCWVTQMVPKEDDGSSSSGHNDGNEPYDIGDTYIRYPPHDKKSVFDRLGGGSRGGSSKGGSSSRDRFNDRYASHSGYGYRNRRGRSYSRSRSRSRSRSPRFHIDKKKLLEIAKANALQRMRAGDLPANLPIPDSMKKAADTFAVNESIQKFTDRCKALANYEGGSSDDDSPINHPVGSDDEEDGSEAQKPFVRHPFKVKEAAPIVMNIRNAIQIPVGSKDKLRTTFPVSSGSQHRKKEEEIVVGNANDPYGQWTAVAKPEPKPAAAPTTKASTPQPPATPATTPAATPATQTTPATTSTVPAAPAAAVAPAVAGPHIPGVTNVQPPQPVPEKDKVFEDAPGFAYDIGQIVSARLKAARSLQSNPHNVEALTVLHHSQKQIQTWAHSTKKPGLFTGSTDATFLRPEELGNPNRKNQAWIRKVINKYDGAVNAMRRRIWSCR